MHQYNNTSINTTPTNTKRTLKQEATEAQRKHKEENVFFQAQFTAQSGLLNAEK
eukprot:Ihof_evm9s273 gene=Ihof_evmTU9s273